MIEIETTAPDFGLNIKRLSVMLKVIHIEMEQVNIQ